MFPRIQIVILLYILVVVLIFNFKPAMMFDAEGNMKFFGCNDNNLDFKYSLMNIEVVLVSTAILTYFFVICLELAVFS